MRHDSQFKSVGDASAHAEAELAAIEADPAFARAPVIRRLLRYLASESLAGRGATLKSYTVAVEGLGRDPDFDAQADSYPRVQVGRLRKMLDAHYSEHPPAADVEVHIPSGGYCVEFIDRRSGRDRRRPSPQSPLLQGRLGSLVRTISPLGLVIAAIAWAALAVYWLFGGARPESDWTTHNFPIVVIGEIAALDGTPEQRMAAADLRTSISEMISRFDTVDVAEPPAANAQYRLEGSLRNVQKGTLVQLSLIEMQSGKVIWARSGVPEPVTDGLLGVAEVASNISGVLAQPWGVIHSNQRARRVSTGTPYGCWLEFMTYWRNRDEADQKTVQTCVARWKQGDPASSLAHAESAWLLVDEATGTTGDARRQLLARAKDVALLAVELDPNSPVAYYALMHATQHRGELQQMNDAANRIMQLNPNSRELAALVAVHRIYAGDIKAAELLEDALAKLEHPSHGYYTGLFFAAVMNDDADAALRAALKFQTMRPTALQRAVLAMAEARSGHLDNARRHWRQAVTLDPSLARDPRAVFARRPLAPPIRERCMAWLKPVL